MTSANAAAPLRLGIAGVGTVGGGVMKLLAANGDAIAARAGRPIRVAAVSARNRNRDRGVDMTGIAWEDDPMALIARDDVDAIVETIGGANGPAKAVVEGAIAAGKPVATANKAMLAHHGAALARAADAAGVAVGWEAAVAGGVPIVKALREGLAANQSARLYGILNGTCNYILTRMEETGAPFAEILKAAQDLGYAEADPSFDVGGVDTAHKLALLAALAFGVTPDFDAVSTVGIEAVSPADIAFARDFGYRIKLLGVARRTDDGIVQQVAPVMTPIGAAIADVMDVVNAVVVEGDFVGQTVYEGRGAGEGPTASAVVADLIDIARGRVDPMFGVPADRLAAPVAAPSSTRRGAFYLRLMVVDRPGVIADVARALADHQVSIDRMVQRGREPGGVVPVVIVTHDVGEDELRAAVKTISAIEAVTETPAVIQIESA